MVKLIDDYAGEEHKADFVPFQAILKALDRLIDIMNAKVANGPIQKGCEVIDCQDHRHLDELLQIAGLFAEWKNEATDSTRFIPETSFEDLLWLCFGTIGIARTYLINGSRRFDQSRHGSDVCEHHFGNLRMKNSNPSLEEARQGTAKATAARTNAFDPRAKTNTKGAPRSQVDELMEPLEKRCKHKNY